MMGGQGGMGSMLAGLGSGGAGSFLFLLQLGLFIFHLAALVTEGGDNPMIAGDDDMSPEDYRCLRDPVTGDWRTEADEKIHDLWTIMVVLVVIDGLMSFGIACLSAGACCVFGACCLGDGMQACDAWCINCFTASSGILITLLYLAQFICSAIVLVLDSTLPKLPITNGIRHPLLLRLHCLPSDLFPRDWHNPLDRNRRWNIVVLLRHVLPRVLP